MRKTSGQGTFQATSVPEPATLTLTARHRGLRPAVLQVAATRVGRRAPRRTRVWNLLEYARRNPTMATVEKTPAIDPEVVADLEAVCNTKGIVRDPKLLRRITERADQVRQETLRF